jgi:HSP20 family protein
MTAHDPCDWMWNEACTQIERAARMHRQFFQPGLRSAPTPGWEPPIDIFENEHAIHIVAAMPGVAPQDFKIEVNGSEVVISGLRRLPALPPGAAIHRLEIPHGHFERRVHLSAVELKLAHSELASGCLTLRLTKRS